MRKVLTQDLVACYELIGGSSVSHTMEVEIVTYYNVLKVTANYLNMAVNDVNVNEVTFIGLIAVNFAEIFIIA